MSGAGRGGPPPARRAGAADRAWRAFDATLVRATEILLFVVGVVFTVFLCLGVVGRYVADFSLVFVEAGARFLLVWFFLLGAGLALRERAHVGFELARGALPPTLGRAVRIVAHLCVLLFGALILSGTVEALGISASHTEPTVGLSLLWAVLSVPVGVALMLYHQVCVIAEDLTGAGRGAPTPPPD
jgi:TRAP-type C4-dicarboxylate transport system permease small subunit